MCILFLHFTIHAFSIRINSKNIEAEKPLKFKNIKNILKLRERLRENFIVLMKKACTQLYKSNEKQLISRADREDLEGDLEIFRYWRAWNILRT